MAKLDDLIEEFAKEFVKEELPPDPSDEEKQKQREFFFGGAPEYLGPLTESRRADGLCPKCGELGRIHLSAMICETHGVY